MNKNGKKECEVLIETVLILDYEWINREFMPLILSLYIISYSLWNLSSLKHDFQNGKNYWFSKWLKIEKSMWWS